MLIGIMNPVYLITEVTAILTAVFHFVIPINPFNRTTHNLAITNSAILNLKLLFWTENQLMCYSLCVARLDEEPKTVAKYSSITQKCECFLTSYDFLIEFQDTDPKTSEVFMFSREFNQTEI